jgi:hypothetical protein
MTATQVLVVAKGHMEAHSGVLHVNLARLHVVHDRDRSISIAASAAMPSTTPASTQRPTANTQLSRRSSYAGGNEMNAVKMAAIVLIAAGILGLAYGSFSYTKDTHEATLGPLELSVEDKETVNIPVWAGVGAIVIGGALLLVGGKKG